MIAAVVAQVLNKDSSGTGNVVGDAILRIGAKAAGDIVSQSVGVATGIQDKFSWNQVGMTAVAATINETGIGDRAASPFKNDYLRAAVHDMVNSAITQGIGAATGMQKEFSWAGVAAAGAGAMAGVWADKHLPGREEREETVQFSSPASDAHEVGVAMAELIANAAARSLIEGTDSATTFAPHCLK